MESRKLDYACGGWYHFSGLCSRDGVLKVGKFLPIPKQQGKAGEKTIVDAAHVGNSLERRRAIKTTLSGLDAAHKRLPGIKVIGIVFLRQPISILLQGRNWSCKERYDSAIQSLVFVF